MTSRPERLAERITPTLLLLLALGGALLVVTPRRAGADPNNANCKPNRATCTAKHQCCSGACTKGLCATPTTATSTTTTTTTTSTTTTTLACGNGMIDAGEQCDGTNLGGASCESLGYNNYGTLACTASCTFNTSGCQCQAFPATGQTTCWSSSGFVISCTGTGQDGDIKAGAPLSYTDNGDGTITDNNTGLMWEKLSMDGSVHDVTNTYTWDNAFATHVATLNSGTGFAGHTDWRLPNAKELHSIVNYEKNVNPTVSSEFNAGCMSMCTVLTCSCTASGNYWSSNTAASTPTVALVVGFFNGGVGFADKESALDFVRGVRGGS